MDRTRRPSAVWAGFLLCGVAQLFCGCTTLPTSSPVALDQQMADRPDASREVVVVIKPTDEAEREFLKAPVQPNMLIEDALKGSGATRRFRRMDVTLVRRTPGGQLLRLPIKFDIQSRRVASSTNYAVHPGDRLEVVEDTSSIVDRMLESVVEPLRPITRSAYH